MNWDLDKDRPIVPQICEQVCVCIANGEFPPNGRLMSVREAALGAGVNPNTVQKAFESLENKGVIFSQRGSGWYVAEDISIAKATVEEMKKKKTEYYFKAMELLGSGCDETKKYVERWRI